MHSAFLEVLESSEIEDAVGAIKAAANFSKHEFKLIQEQAEQVGLNVAKLEEATAAEQLQATKIVAGALGIKTTGTDAKSVLAEIKKKATTMKISGDQKKIYSDMLNMLTKLGMVVEVHEDPEYELERKVLGYSQLKQRLAVHTGIKNYGEVEPGNKKKLVGVADDKTARHENAHSLNASNNTHRMQMARKLMGHD